MDKYILTIAELKKLCRDFQVDCYDGFVSNDESYIESWLEENEMKKNNSDWMDDLPFDNVKNEPL